MPEKILLTPKQEAWFIKHFKHTPNAEVCKKLGISLSTMHRIKRELGLKKTPQFMKKWSDIGAKLAREVNKANNWPPKDYIIPNTNRFKKGESNKDRLTPKRYAEMQEKRRLSWIANRKKDYARFVWGLEQKTRHRFIVQSSSKLNYRSNMKKKGYIVNLEHNVFFYTSEEMRHPIAEKNGSKYGIIFKPLNN